MPRSEVGTRGLDWAFDWRGWLALAWASWFGVLYAGMVLVERAPGVLLSTIDRAGGIGQNMV